MRDVGFGGPLQNQWRFLKVCSRSRLQGCVLVHSAIPGSHIGAYAKHTVLSIQKNNTYIYIYVCICVCLLPTYSYTSVYQQDERHLEGGRLQGFACFWGARSGRLRSHGQTLAVFGGLSGGRSFEELSGPLDSTSLVAELREARPATCCKQELSFEPSISRGRWSNMLHNQGLVPGLRLPPHLERRRTAGGLKPKTDLLSTPRGSDVESAPILAEGIRLSRHAWPQNASAPEHPGLMFLAGLLPSSAQ